MPGPHRCVHVYRTTRADSTESRDVGRRCQRYGAYMGGCGAIAGVHAAHFQSAQYRIDRARLNEGQATCIEEIEAPCAACADADLVTTDTWTSMGFESEHEARQQAFARWQVTSECMARARPDALFMHCLPEHRGKEVSAEVIDGPQSVVWTEAENRLHVQKALMEFLLLGRIKSE